MKLKVACNRFYISYFFSENHRIRNKESESIEIVTKNQGTRNSPGDEKSTGEKSEVVFTICRYL
jgi:hypothetical protein